MKTWKKTATRVFAPLLAAALLASCSSGDGNAANETGGQATATQAPAAKLPVRYLLPGNAPQDLDTVVAAINEKLAADGLNLEYEPIYIPWDVWDQKTNLMMSTGEEFELIAIMHDVKGPNVLAGNGGIIPIDELLEEYGAELKASMPEWIWDSAKINGEITYIPNFWLDTAFNDGMVTLRKDLLEKNGLEAPKSPEDLLAVAETLQANWPQDNKNVYIKLLAEPATFLHTTYDSYPFSVIDNLIYVDQEGTVKSWLETEEFKKDVEYMNEAYTRGLILKDVLTTPTEVLNQEELAGRYLYRPGDVGIDDRIRETFPGAEVNIYFLGDQPKFRSYAIRNSNGVSATSPHPEAGVQFLNWVFSNQGNFDLVQSGVEGVNWTNTGENTRDFLSLTDAGGPTYELANWLLGHVEMNRYPTSSDPGRMERRTTIADDAVNSVTIGFNFDPTNVASAYANSVAELQTSVFPLMYGVISYESGFAGALRNMKAAGLDTVVEEYARQFAEWRSSQ
ncbi:extracellular solute-binding protein [Paenibacillus sp. S150]|uniref:extracellular solute-binding protein n=1 Tax=Paenibacillus sp. S150 TaxID=2749826 RepID=UPI001C576A85|nr:extracellular solute-binding protein [Paenibacillus sp. S150]MBW4083132.1 extracellular solute-binding protein [Paenibacillus sp. S150]